MFVSLFLLRFVAIAKILLTLSIMGGVRWLAEGGFAEQFGLNLHPVTKVIATD